MSETDQELASKQDETNKVWQEYLQTCCEVGQLLHALDSLDSQKRAIEKQVEVKQKSVKSLSHKHKQLKAGLPANEPESMQ